jgi:phospholipid/cholesterol/gamma-HCH transport system substrate-binding protein
MSRKLPEILTGLVILIIAALFLVYALGRAQAIGGSGYLLKAQFADIGGLTVGSNVEIGGVTVGHVVDASLNPQTYAAVVTVRINNDVKLPEDTSASISSEGLLGGNYVGLSPGGSETMLAPGQSFQVTQSAINLENLLGQFIFNMGKSGGESTGQTTGQSGAASGAPASNPASLSGASGSK